MSACTPLHCRGQEAQAELTVPIGLHPQAMPRAGYLRSPSWTRAREHGREKKHLSDSELQPGTLDTFLAVEQPQQE